VIGVKSYINSNKRAEEARRRELETRQAQLFMGVYQTWATKDSLRQLEKVLALNFKDYEDWLRKYGPNGENSEDHSSWDFVMSYMDGLGSLVKRDLIDPRFVAELMGLPVIYTFQKFRSVIIGQRAFNSLTRVTLRRCITLLTTWFRGSRMRHLHLGEVKSDWLL
jgi:hypothetical protein